MPTTFMGVAYIALMAFCLWAADGERANYASACQRVSNNSAAPLART
jgi:hypothetical protein